MHVCKKMKVQIIHISAQADQGPFLFSAYIVHVYLKNGRDKAHLHVTYQKFTKRIESKIISLFTLLHEVASWECNFFEPLKP